jgi:hypothetical protein
MNTTTDEREIELTLIAERVPEHDHDGLINYVLRGRPVGDFLEAVLENNLTGAFGRADTKNRAALFEICAWLYNEAPCEAWGNPAKVSAWITDGGRYGRRAARAAQEGTDA